jgi:hypothetical protein
MKNLQCPQCGIHRFYIKNEKEENLLVTVSENYEIKPVHPEESTEGYDLTLLYCLGCSWKGSPTKLRGNEFQKKYYP